MESILNNAKKASFILKNISASLRSKVIEDIADLISDNKDEIIFENKKDILAAKESGLSAAMIDRLYLDYDRLEGIVKSTKNIAYQEDPIGEVLFGKTLPNGLKIVKIRVPMGVVGVIYESRPNVTIDCAALCLRSGNVAILRGGKEAIFSNKVFEKIIKIALNKNHLPESCVSLLDDPDRSKMLNLIRAKGFVDIIIPRGGTGLINFVSENAYVPVIKHDKGVCCIYVDSSAVFDDALNIIYNSKISRPSACNAVETVLLHESIALSFLPLLKERLSQVKLYGDAKARSVIDILPVKQWDQEFLSLEMNIGIVSNIEEAVNHITTYGSSHSDAIITENYCNAEYFLDSIDSACVYVNASTRFTDGGEFGFGAEVGISTDKIHARGPMGAFDLTTSKYKIYGDGQIR